MTSDSELEEALKKLVAITIYMGVGEPPKLYASEAKALLIAIAIKSLTECGKQG